MNEKHDGGRWVDGVRADGVGQLVEDRPKNGNIQLRYRETGNSNFTSKKMVCTASADEEI